ncbi:MAG: hypothetical protein QM610_15975 [Chitinophagaceae bacterium]
MTLPSNGASDIKVSKAPDFSKTKGGDVVSFNGKEMTVTGRVKNKNNGKEYVALRDGNGNVSHVDERMWKSGVTGVDKGMSAKSVSESERQQKIKDAGEVEDDSPRGQVLHYFLGNGKINMEALTDLLGRRGKAPQEETQNRIWMMGKGGKGIEELAHRLWDTSENRDRFTTSDFRDAVEDVLLSHQGKESMADELLSQKLGGQSYEDWYRQTHGEPEDRPESDNDTPTGGTSERKYDWWDENKGGYGMDDDTPFTRKDGKNKKDKTQNNSNFAENIINKDGSIDEKGLSETADAVVDGRLVLRGTYHPEGGGKTETGRRTVEATLLLEGDRGAGGGELPDTRATQKFMITISWLTFSPKEVCCLKLTWGKSNRILKQNLKYNL